MISRKELRKISQARLKDARVLYNAARYDGSTYLCGYAIETSLKARICKTLHWNEFPFTNKEFQNLQSLKTHNLDVLLSLSGLEIRIKTHFLAEWSAVAAWDPEARYKTPGNITRSETKLMIDSTDILLEALR